MNLAPIPNTSLVLKHMKLSICDLTLKLEHEDIDSGILGSTKTQVGQSVTFLISLLNEAMKVLSAGKVGRVGAILMSSKR